MSDNDSSIEAIAEQRNRLLSEVARLRASKVSEVPVEMLSAATDYDSALALAQEAIAWRDAGTQASPAQSTPATQTGAATYGIPGQISRATFELLSDEQRMDAVRRGQCVGLGIGVPTRDMGTQRNGRHV